MMSKRILLLLGACLTALWPSSALAQEQLEPVDETKAVREAAKQNPGLRAALLDIQEAEATVEAEEDRYPLSLLLDATETHTENPSLNGGGVVNGTNDSVTLGSELRKSFAWGTSLSFRLEGAVSRSSFAILPNDSETLTQGPGYALNARFDFMQPLLRGFGTNVGEAELRAASYRREALDHARERIASETMRDVLTAYWELWYASAAQQIEQEARALAETERKQLQDSIDAGATAGVDIYSFETRVRERDEAVTLAELDRRRRSLTLGTQMGRRKSGGLVAEDSSPPEPEPMRDRDTLVKQALENSPQLEELEAQIEAARDRERVAGDADRHRLDLTGWVQTRGLGNQDAGAAVRQFGRFGAVSAQLGLVYELPLTGSRVESQRAAARAASAAAEARKEQVELSIETSVDTNRAEAEAAARRIDLADKTTEAAERQLQAAKDRYDIGDGLAIDVQRAEDTLRRARLRALRARVDWVQSRVVLDHLTGELLVRYADLVEVDELKGPGDEARLQMGLERPSGPF